MKALISVSNDTIMNTFFTEENKRLAKSLGEIKWCKGKNDLTKEELCELISDCDVYVTCWDSPPLDGEILAAAPKLRLLTHLGSTVTPFVCDEVWERGIHVISAFDYFSESTAEGAIAYMLAALRNIPFYNDRLKGKRIWSKEGDTTDGLIYKTVGIVSYGGVGRHIVRKLSNFNVKIKVYDIVDVPAEEKEKYGIEQCGIEELFSTCDIISLHTPYNSQTHHMIDGRLLSMIKKGALFVNTARGPIVDQAALTEHLTRGDFNAALDVYEVEPIDMKDPLLDLDNVLMLPHQGGVTTNLRPVLTRDLLMESAAFIDKGEPLKNEIFKAQAAGMSKF
jgi:phosphoglycerate dehydrogenase-like enzyme